MAATQYTQARRRAIAKRMKTPTAKLPKAQQRMRAFARQHGHDAGTTPVRAQPAADRDPLYNPTRQLAGTALQKAVGDLVDMEYAPQEAALARQAQNATTQGTALLGRQRGYYDQLAEQTANDVAKAQAIGQLTQDQLTRSGQDTDAQIARAQSDEQARRTQDAASRGAGLEGSSDAVGELAALKARSAEGAGVARNQAAVAGESFAGLVGLGQQARGLRGDELQQQLANRLANEQAGIRAQQTDLSSQRGGAATKQLLSLRQSGFENLVTQRGLGIKQEELQSDAEKAMRDDLLQKRGQDITAHGQRIAAATQRAGQQVTARGQDLSVSERRADRQSRERIARERIAAQGGPRRKNETAQSVKFRQNIAGGRGRFKALMRKYKGDEARVKRVMIERDGVPPEAYNAIYDLERTGTLHPANARALRALGVRVPKQWRRKPSKPVSQRTSRTVNRRVTDALGGLG